MAQGPYSFDPTAEGNNVWGNSVKWGLPSGYPDDSGIIVELHRVGAATALSLDGLSITIGELHVGVGGSGSSAWTISGGSPGGVLQLDNATAPAKIRALAGTTTISAQMLAQNGVTFEGAYSVILTNTQTVLNGGIAVNGGGNIYLNRASMAGNSTIALNASGSVRIGGNADTAVLANNFTVAAGGLRGIYGYTKQSLTLSGNITGDGGVLFGDERASNNAFIDLTGNNSYKGDTEIRSSIRFQSIDNFGEGSLTFTTNDRTLTHATGNTADITVNRNGDTRAVALNSETTIDTGGNEVTYSNTISGSEALRKSGAGTLWLEGDNTFAGAIVAEGRLAARHANALGGGGAEVSVLDGGELYIDSATHLAVGDLLLDDSARIVFNLGGSPDTASLYVLGAVSGSGTVEIGIDIGAGISAGTYELALFEGGGDLPVFSLDTLSSGYGQLLWDAGTGTLSFQAIPEPGTVALLVGGIALIAFRKRFAA